MDRACQICAIIFFKQYFSFLDRNFWEKVTHMFFMDSQLQKISRRDLVIQKLFFCQKIPKWALQTSLLYDSYFLKWIWLFNNDIFLENNKILYFLKSPTWNMNRMIFYILSCTKLVALVSTILQMKNKTIFSIKPMDLSKTSFVYYKNNHSFLIIL